MSKKAETKKLNVMHEVVATSIPIVITLGAFAMIVLLRRMEHNEKLKMIEKGIDVNQFRQQKKSGTGAIKFALMAVGIGIGLLVGNVLDAYTTLNDEICYFSMIFLFGGIGLFVGYKIADQKEKEDEKLNQ